MCVRRTSANNLVYLLSLSTRCVMRGLVDLGCDKEMKYSFIDDRHIIEINLILQTKCSYSGFNPFAIVLFIESVQLRICFNDFLNDLAVEPVNIPEMCQKLSLL